MRGRPFQFEADEREHAVLDLVALAPRHPLVLQHGEAAANR